MATHRREASPGRVQEEPSFASGLFCFIVLLVFLWAVAGGPSSEELDDRAADAYYEQRSQERFKQYIATCAGAFYPSSACPAWWEGDDESASDEYPCYPDQVKANRRSGLYHTPDSPLYVRTRADVVCYQSAALAAQAGFRPARGSK
jgi:hypothetical protein